MDGWMVGRCKVGGCMDDAESESNCCETEKSLKAAKEKCLLTGWSSKMINRWRVLGTKEARSERSVRSAERKIKPVNRESCPKSCSYKMKAKWQNCQKNKDWENATLAYLHCKKHWRKFLSAGIHIHRKN
jgi:hypothetical protein